MPEFDHTEVVEMSILIHATGGSGVCYARPIKSSNPEVSPEDQVFIPQGVAARFSMCPGDVFRCRVVPNNSEKRDRVKWRSIYIVPPAGYIAPTKPVYAAPVRPQKTDEQIKDEVAKVTDDGLVWTTRTVFSSIFNREVDHKDEEDHRLFSLIGNHLRLLQRSGKLCSAELYGKSENATAVYFATTMDALIPEGY